MVIALKTIDELKNDLIIKNCILGFKCSKKFGEMTLTDDEEIRHCDVCHKNVHLCRSIEDLGYEICEGHCVAFPKNELLNLDDNGEEMLVGMMVEPEYLIEDLEDNKNLKD